MTPAAGQNLNKALVIEDKISVLWYDSAQSPNSLVDEVVVNKVEPPIQTTIQTKESVDSIEDEY